MFLLCVTVIAKALNLLKIFFMPEAITAWALVPHLIKLPATTKGIQTAIPQYFEVFMSTLVVAPFLWGCA